MKKNLEILEVEPKLKKDESKYWRFKTNEGWMNVFDSMPAEALKLLIGKVACVEMTEKPGKNFRGEDIVFKNITKCYGAEQGYKDEERAVGMGMVDEKPEVVRPGEMITPGYPKPITAYNNKNTTMYTSYAKDIFCAMYATEYEAKDIMDLAIELVKQARKAFE